MSICFEEARLKFLMNNCPPAKNSSAIYNSLVKGSNKSPIYVILATGKLMQISESCKYKSSLKTSSSSKDVM